MTNKEKEAVEILKTLKEDYWDDDGYGHETKQYDDTMLAFDMAIKALEQEPILDKIRAEIEQMDFDFGDFYDNTGTIRKMVLEVIDKYKTESKEGAEYNADNS